VAKVVQFIKVETNVHGQKVYEGGKTSNAEIIIPVYVASGVPTRLRFASAWWDIIMASAASLIKFFAHGEIIHPETAILTMLE
jgi:hypothetical protein